MTSKGTPVRTYRMPDELYQQFGEYAERNGYDRTEIIVALVKGLLNGSVSVTPRKAPDPFPADSRIVLKVEKE